MKETGAEVYVSISVSGIKCPMLVLPNNAEVESNNQNAHVCNTTINYRCAKDHDLMFGDLTRTCQSSKTWTGDAPVCRSTSKLILSSSPCSNTWSNDARLLLSK